MQKGGWVYILTNKYHSVLYTGVTSDLIGRMQEHRSKFYPSSFTARYNIDKLVYYCLYHSIEEAIEEEKRIKGGSRTAKMELVNQLNASWDDLWLTDVCKWWGIASCLAMTITVITKSGIGMQTHRERHCEGMNGLVCWPFLKQSPAT